MSIPSKCIPIADARVLQQNWLNTRQQVINQHLGYEDQNELFISVAELEEYLNYVKSESANQRIENPGIRIYFAAYDNDQSNLATVFLSPTNGPTVDSANNYNILPLNRSVGSRPPVKY
jgi:hypothetical protein